MCSSVAGQECSHEDEKFFGKYIFNCPCAAGLSCDPQDVSEIWVSYIAEHI